MARPLNDNGTFQSLNYGWHGEYWDFYKNDEKTIEHSVQTGILTVMLSVCKLFSKRYFYQLGWADMKKITTFLAGNSHHCQRGCSRFGPPYFSTYQRSFSSSCRAVPSLAWHDI
jgi:hypothetical protein